MAKDKGKKKLGMTTLIFIGLFLGAFTGIILYYFVPSGYVRDDQYGHDGSADWRVLPDCQNIFQYRFFGIYSDGKIYALCTWSTGDSLPWQLFCIDGNLYKTESVQIYP